MKKLLPIIAFFFNAHPFKELQTNLVYDLATPEFLGNIPIFYQKNNQMPGIDWSNHHIKTPSQPITEFLELGNGDYVHPMAHRASMGLDGQCTIKPIRRYVRLVSQGLATKPKACRLLTPESCSAVFYTTAGRVDPVMSIDILPVIPPHIPPFMPLLSPWFMAMTQNKNAPHNSSHDIDYDIDHDTPPTDEVVEKAANEALEPDNAVSSKNGSNASIVVVSEQDNGSMPPEQNSSVTPEQNSSGARVVHHGQSQPRDAVIEKATNVPENQIGGPPQLVSQLRGAVIEKAANEPDQAGLFEAAGFSHIRTLAEQLAETAAADAARVREEEAQRTAAAAGLFFLQVNEIVPLEAITELFLKKAERAKATEYYEGIGEMWEDTEQVEEAQAAAQARVQVQAEAKAQAAAEQALADRARAAEDAKRIAEAQALADQARTAAQALADQAEAKARVQADALVQAEAAQRAQAAALARTAAALADAKRIADARVREEAAEDAKRIAEAQRTEAADAPATPQKTAKKGKKSPKPPKTRAYKTPLVLKLNMTPVSLNANRQFFTQPNKNASCSETISVFKSDDDDDPIVWRGYVNVSPCLLENTGSLGSSQKNLLQYFNSVVIPDKGDTAADKTTAEKAKKQTTEELVNICNENTENSEEINVVQRLIKSKQRIQTPENKRVELGLVNPSCKEQFYSTFFQVGKTVGNAVLDVLANITNMAPTPYRANLRHNYERD